MRKTNTNVEVDTPTYRGKDRRKPMLLPSPQQIDALMPALQRAGFVGLSFLLVWVLQGTLRSDVSDIKTDIKAHILASDEREKDATERDDLLKSIRDITVQQCVNAAANSAKVDACFAAMTSGPVRPAGK
jgi:hypothetical protein